MNRLRFAWRAAWVAGCLVLAGASAARAGTAPVWTLAELASFSDAIVTGEVVDVTSAWDPAAGAIYTYTTIGIAEIVKGPLPDRSIIIKQLGGVVGEVALAVADQADFARRERVLLFLEVRPRDRSLYTTGLWQGKWTLVTLPGGLPGAVRGSHTITLDEVRGAARSAQAIAAPAADGAASMPVTGPAGQAFSLMATPYLYSFFPPVDTQAGGQPGLPGGGQSEVQTAVDRWNAAGASFRFLPGSPAGAPRCANQFLGTYRVTISFLDPCGEISNSGGTLAIAGSYFTTVAGVTVNGVLFRLALEGFVINNDSPVALEFLNTSGCFQDIQLHELGHVFGLGHSADPAAVMFPSINRACATTPSRLSVDDLAGMHFIYPASAPGAPGRPIIAGASAVGEVLTVAWFSGPGAAPTTHRLDFFSGAIPVASVLVGPATIVGLPLATGVQGVFSVQITAFNGATAGPPSDPLTFTLGGGCLTPPHAPNPVGAVLGGTATVSWAPVPGATHYVLQAGTSLGGSDIVSPTHIGSTTSVSASGVPAGFQAWVRVTAVDACGGSAVGDLLLR